MITKLVVSVFVAFAFPAMAAGLNPTSDRVAGEPEKFAAEEIRRAATAKGMTLVDGVDATRISISVGKDATAVPQSYRIERDGEILP